MNAMPCARAVWTSRTTTGAPPMSTSPESGCSIPPATFIRVDLPAPFSPSSATTSPGCTSRETPFSACTPRKRFWMLRSSRTGTPIPAEPVWDASATAKLGQFLPELVDVVLSQHSRRDEHLMARRNTGFVASQDLRHERHRLVAELEWLLHDGASDGARLDAGQRLVLFIERDDRHLPDLVRIADGIENCRAVVAPQPDEGGHIGVRHERLRDVRLRAYAIGVVGAHIENLNLGAGDGLLDPLQPLLRVARIDLPDEQHDLAAVGQD